MRKELELAAKGAHPFLIKPNLREMEATRGIELRTMRAIRDAALLPIYAAVHEKYDAQFEGKEAKLDEIMYIIICLYRLAI